MFSNLVSVTARFIFMKFILEIFCERSLFKDFTGQKEFTVYVHARQLQLVLRLSEYERVTKA